MAAGNGLDYLLGQPLAERNNTLLVAGGAAVPALTGKGEEILISAGIALDAGEAVLEDAAVLEKADDVSHIGSEESVLPGKPFIVHLLQGRACPKWSTWPTSGMLPIDAAFENPISPIQLVFAVSLLPRRSRF
jgi:hypothetical protein